MLGHIDFVKKIIEINPQLVCEVNLQKHSPLHLAAAKGRVHVVKALLSVDDRVTCLARDRNGLTPVHLAAMKGRNEAVKLLLEEQPDAARMLVHEDEETILHLCVKNNQIEALKLILATVDDAEFVNSKDAHGDTLLHLAVADKQVETTKFLVSMGAPLVEVNAQNEEGLTAMDVLIRSRRDVRDSSIEKSLKHAGGVAIATETTTTTTTSNDNSSSSCIASVFNRFFRSKNKAIQSSEGLLAMAALIVTIITQNAATPPGGVWQEDNFLMDSKGNYVDPLGRVSNPVDSHNTTVLYPHQAGYSVLARNDPDAYQNFRTINGLGFYASLSVMSLLMAGTPLTNTNFNVIFFTMSYFAFTAAVNSYETAVEAVTPKSIRDPAPFYTGTTGYITFLLPGLFGIFYLLWLFLKFITWPLRAWRRPAGVVEDRPETGRIRGAAPATSPLPVV